METYTIEPVASPDQLGPEEPLALMRGMKTVIAAFEVALRDVSGTAPVIDIDGEE
jgi:hypothetical protein